jgi:hypothetical protein
MSSSVQEQDPVASETWTFTISRSQRYVEFRAEGGVLKNVQVDDCQEAAIVSPDYLVGLARH